MTFDFADFRKGTLKDDLAHRDFTVNTLCVDIENLNRRRTLDDILIDVRGGFKDLKSKKIRMVSKRSFREDPLRLIRAFSLQAMLGLTIEKRTLRQIRKDKNLISEVAYERIRDEFFKILSTPYASYNLKMIDRIGLLKEIIPQVAVMYRVKQGGYHHLDVWRHSLQTVVVLEGVFEEFKNNSDIWKYINEPLGGDRIRLSLLKLAALLHDIGKPEARKKENGKTTFYGHERIGRNMVRHIAFLLKLSTKERYALEDIVLWHLRPGYLSNVTSPTRRAIFRYFRDTKDEALSILLLSLADQRATRGPLTTDYDQRHHAIIVRKLIKTYLDKKKETPFIRLINGHDLIRELKLEPSPLFAKILREVEEKQATGLIATKKEALRLALKIARQAKRKNLPHED
jgi:poly(A) polymerase